MVVVGSLAPSQLKKDTDIRANINKYWTKREGEASFSHVRLTTYPCMSDRPALLLSLSISYNRVPGSLNAYKDETNTFLWLNSSPAFA